MGWNDHVEYVQMRCDKCGAIEDWTIWNATAKARYGGANKRLGDFLNIDVSKGNCCPLCGSTEGTPTDE